MPITIDYNNFINPISNLISGVEQPHQYKSIYTGISNLRLDDPTIIFTNLPSGTRILDDPATTEPYDSVFMDFESMNDYVLLNYSIEGDSEYWSADGGAFVASYTSGGFWAIGDATTNLQPQPFVFTTGAGNANSSVLDIEFQPISSLYTEDILLSSSFDRIELEKGRSYVFQEDSEFYPDIVFNQTENTNWYPVNIKKAAEVPNGQQLLISGVAFTGGAYQTVTVDLYDAGSHIYWQNGELFVTNEQLYGCPEPFSSHTFSQGYNWVGTVANEILSRYTVISGNENNSGIGVIQLNTQASNGQSFSSLISPLRKLHINFSRP